MTTLYLKFRMDDTTAQELTELAERCGAPQHALPLEDGAIIPIDLKDALDNMGVSLTSLYNLIKTLYRS